MYTPFSIQLLLGLKKRINGKPKFTLICVEKLRIIDFNIVVAVVAAA